MQNPWRLLKKSEIVTTLWLWFGSGISWNHMYYDRFVDSSWLERVVSYLFRMFSLKSLKQKRSLLSPQVLSSEASTLYSSVGCGSSTGSHDLPPCGRGGSHGHVPAYSESHHYIHCQWTNHIVNDVGSFTASQPRPHLLHLLLLHRWLPLILVLSL